MSIPLTQFSRLLSELSATASKLKQTELVANFLREIAKKDGSATRPTSTDYPYSEVAQAFYLILGQVGPEYATRQYQFGVQFMLAALAQLDLPLLQHKTSEQDLFGNTTQSARDMNVAQVKKRYKALGDMGKLAQEIGEARAKAGIHKKQALDTVGESFAALWRLTDTGGQGSQEEKIQQVVRILEGLEPEAASHGARILMGTLRWGVSSKTLLDSLSWALAGNKTLREELDAVYQRHPDIGRMAAQVVQVLQAHKGGELDAEKAMQAISQLGMEIGVPVLPALCDRLKSTEEMVRKMGKVFVEPKYDGTRVQIHYDPQHNKLFTYTRNLEESTLMFPELQRLLEAVPSINKPVVFDSEAVGYDPKTKHLVEFQLTIKRKRKHDIEAMSAEIPLKFFVFDILYWDGKSQLRVPLSQRKELLAKVLGVKRDPATLKLETGLSHKGGDIEMSPHIETDDPALIAQYHDEQLAAGLEGVVVKKLDGIYQPGRQAFNWVKLKEKEGASAKLADTVDVVVLGYYFGRGKRTAFGVGAFLVGVVDQVHDKILTIAKIGTGLTDEQWRELKERCDKLKVDSGEKSRGWEVVIPDSLEPGVWVRPGLVVEVAADEITRSPVHTAGLALRFPRLVRFRDDKGVEQATTLKEFQKMAKEQ